MAAIGHGFFVPTVFMYNDFSCTLDAVLQSCLKIKKEITCSFSFILYTKFHTYIYTYHYNFLFHLYLLNH